MNAITTRTKFTVEMTYDGRKFRKIDPTGSWTTYPVEPMTLAQAEFVCADHSSRGTTSTFVVIDVEYEAAQMAFARNAKELYLQASGYNDLTRDEQRRATEIRKSAITVFASAKADFLLNNPQQC